MNLIPPARLVAWLRAAGEPSRLRLLLLCREGALGVSDLAQALGQSEPRVSRHLRILCEAGLLVRLRQGQWVHYRLSENAAASAFVRDLLVPLDRRDPLLTRDRSRAAAAGAPQAVPGGTPSRLGRALAEFLEAGGGADLGRTLVAGVAHLELLASAAAAARECTAIAHSRRAAQSARAFAERRGFRCRVLLGSTAGGLTGQDLARAGPPFDAVLLDHLASGEGALARALEQARSALAAQGRLWVFQRYESLESARERIVEHPLARLRRLLEAAGLRCERLSPIEADGEHVLAAAVRPAGGIPGRLAAGSAP
ncbi:MAG TPA: metalloregulator ArsR/SmtB family transcription factor [Steroidobacteraceae bacterium]|nr:metalloregulator ArsR/SmtB family transcription factor [Steroidobacteraceae bacterium]